jgi:hypothetical protein
MLIDLKYVPGQRLLGVLLGVGVDGWHQELGSEEVAVLLEVRQGPHQPPTAQLTAAVTLSRRILGHVRRAIDLHMPYRTIRIVPRLQWRKLRFSHQGEGH